MKRILRSITCLITIPFALVLAGCDTMPEGCGETAKRMVSPKASTQIGFSIGPALTTHRYNHASTVLADGRVLVCGGMNEPVSGTYGKKWNAYSALNSCELLDRATETFSPAASMKRMRFAHRITLLASGMVLVSGGQHMTSFPRQTEIYDPETPDTWSDASAMEQGRIHFTATYRPGEARVLVVGGTNDSITESEYFRVAGSNWEQDTTEMQERRYEHAAALLPDAELSILVAGGSAQPFRVLDSAEIFNAATSEWKPVGNLRIKRRRHTLTAIPEGVLSNWPNGGAIAVGGSDEAGEPLRSVEFFDTKLQTWHDLADFPAKVAGHHAILIQNGRRLLVTGGQGEGGRVLATAAVLDLATNKWTTYDMKSARYSHTGELLPDGRVLLIGGINDGVFLASTEIFTPRCASTRDCVAGYYCAVEGVCAAPTTQSN